MGVTPPNLGKRQVGCYSHLGASRTSPWRTMISSLPWVTKLEKQTEDTVQGQWQINSALWRLFAAMDIGTAVCKTSVFWGEDSLPYFPLTSFSCCSKWHRRNASQSVILGWGKKLLLRPLTCLQGLPESAMGG